MYWLVSLIYFLSFDTCLFHCKIKLCYRFDRSFLSSFTAFVSPKLIIFFLSHTCIHPSSVPFQCRPLPDVSCCRKLLCKYTLIFVSLLLVDCKGKLSVVVFHALQSFGLLFTPVLFHLAGLLTPWQDSQDVVSFPCVLLGRVSIFYELELHNNILWCEKLVRFPLHTVWIQWVRWK